MDWTERALTADVAPAADAVRVAGAVDGTDVRGHTLRLELAKG